MAILNRHRLWQVAVDAVLIGVAWYAAFELRFDFGSSPSFEPIWQQTLPIAVGVKIAGLIFFGVYSRWWRYISLRDLWTMGRVLVVASALLFAAFTGYKFPIGSPLVHKSLTPKQERKLQDPATGKKTRDWIEKQRAPVVATRWPMPPSVALIDLILSLALLGGARVLTRTLIERPKRRSLVSQGKDVLIVGAGDAGNLVLREMLSNRIAGYSPIGLVDDDPNKKRYSFQGIKVLGTIGDLPEILRARQPDEVHIALPAAGGKARATVVEACRDAGIPVKTLPNVNDLVSGDNDLVGQLREVQVEDILGRDPVTLDPQIAGAYVRGKTVLVTGAGGSIGSELSRQLARLGPAKLVLLEQGESNLFAIEQELIEGHHGQRLVPVVGDVRNESVLERVFAEHTPQIVFHAAAYKHVPLMEQYPLEAVRNNALATRSVAEAAARHHADRFVLVSTDKAVNPQTVMGASKALAEWVVEAMAQEHPETSFVAVRFGNVLKSSGSVVPTFERQISSGGPVTVTDPAMTRYFMTIAEAASLIVQAGGVGSGGEVFVLDMGEPIKIDDLAREMIRLRGLEPGREIEIVYTGIRPGEKLHEGLWEESERPERTHHDKLMRSRRAPINPDWLSDELGALEILLAAGNDAGVKARVFAMVANPRRADAEHDAPAPVA